MGTPGPAGFGVAALSADLLDDPLAFLSAEHVRQTVLLSHLERLARRPAGPAAAAMAQGLFLWLKDELPLHFADEEASLYPRLAPHDPAGTLAALAADHQRDTQLAGAVLETLRRIAAGEALAPDALAAVLGFVRLHREHLAVEEAKIMPLARAVLTPAAKLALAGEMTVRRGLDRAVGATE